MSQKSLILAAHNQRLHSEARLHASLVPVALDQLERLILADDTPAGVRVQAIGIVLRNSGMAERAARQSAGENPADLRSLSIHEIQAQIDKLSAAMNEKTIEGTINVPNNVPETGQTYDFVE